MLQYWGEQPEFYGQFTYNGIALRGYPGLHFLVDSGAKLVAVDTGRVMEQSNEPGGFERYIKIEHRWGESLYANLGSAEVDAGQVVHREQMIAGLNPMNDVATFHFAIRIFPCNRYDGWGGYTDPLPFIDPSRLRDIDRESLTQSLAHIGELPFAMLVESKETRRP